MALRAVSPGEKPRRRRTPTKVADAAARGTQRELWVALRTRLARAIDDPDTNPKDLSALTRRLQDVVQDIEAIDQREREEGEDGGQVPDEPFDASSL